tara:strand:- start:120 stop:518 length:399 start_codon:yes stop_codon:yes gene_type:complete
MNTTLDQIIEISNEEIVIKQNVPVEYYQKGIYQWWHDTYGCIYVGISAVDTVKKNDGMPLRALHHARKLLSKEKGNTQPTKKWTNFSKKFLEGNHQLKEIKIVYENHPDKSKRDLEEIEHQLIQKFKPICNA